MIAKDPKKKTEIIISSSVLYETMRFVATIELPDLITQALPMGLVGTIDYLTVGKILGITEM